MRMFAGLDVGFKPTAVCGVDEAGRIVSRGMAEAHPVAAWPPAADARGRFFPASVTCGWAYFVETSAPKSPARDEKFWRLPQLALWCPSYTISS
jgi:hypothetical protein